MKLYLAKWYFVLLLLFVIGIQNARAADAREYTIIEDKAKVPILTPGLSERKILKIRLANGLEALLISDPQADKSAAALTVQVGSWDDPKDHPGLAHFLEHMLFLGTKKYPKESEFDYFIHKHGGKTNAYTASTQTSYMFAVDNQAFPEALDRFSSFFIEPLFNPSGVARELQAIDQEYAKNLDNDDIRASYVIKELGSSDHPYHAFHIGNLQTLSGTSQDVLKTWYRQHYSANLMRLVVTSPLSLDQLTSLVVSDFQSIPNINAKAYDQNKPLLSKDSIGQMTYIEPVKDLRSLTILWELPERFTKSMDSQPDVMVCSVLGHEGETSLLAELKRENLAEGLQCGVDRVSGNNWVFQVQFDLTDEGVKHVDEVIGRTFQTIARLKETGVPRYIFDEAQQLATINYQYQQREDAFVYVMGQTRYITKEPLSTYPEHTAIIQKYDPQMISDLVQDLTPQQARFYLVAPEAITGVSPNHQEKWVGVEYAVKPLDKSLMEKWSQAVPDPLIDLPKPNPFIPKNLGLVTSDTSGIEKNIIPVPEVLINDDRGIVYYAMENRYHVPQVHVYFEFKTPQIDIGDGVKAVMADLYVKSVMDALAQYSFPASLAGLNYIVKRTEYGLSITIDGYNEHADLLLREILKQLKNVHLSEQSFALFKDSLLRDYQNTSKQSSLNQAIEVFKKVIYKHFTTDKQKANDLQKVSYEQFNTYAANVFSENYIQGMLYGNITKQEAQAITDIVLHAFPEDYPQGRYKVPLVIVLPKQKGPFYIEENTKAQGNAAILAIENSLFTFKTQAAQNVLMQAMKGPFFTSLRTKQQTGYLVTSYSMDIERRLFDLFAVQSNTHDPRDLLARFELFLEGYLQEIDQEIPEEHFNTIRQTLLEELEQPPKTIQEMGDLLQKLAFKFNGDFEWVDKRIQALKDLTYQEFLILSSEFIGRNNKQRLGILIKGATPPQKSFNYTPIDNIAELHKLSSFNDGK